MIVQRLILILLCGILFIASPRASFAQGFGIAGLLNPEGSRLFPQSVIYPRHPGKPDPRWKAFKWRFVDLNAPSAASTRFRLFFYDEEDWTARFVLPMIKTEIEELAKTFNYSPSRQFNYLLFTSLSQFQQANIFFVSEGVQGITSTTEATMAVPYWGEVSTFEHISMHEMVHQFQVQKITDFSGGADSRAGQAVMAQIPLWFIEGMAEYYSLRGVDFETRFHVRDILNHPDKDRKYEVPKFFDDKTLNFVHVYKLGQARIDFLETTFGKGTAQRILTTAIRRLMSERLLFSTVVTAETGQSIAQLETGWSDYLKKNYNADGLTQNIDDFERYKEAGETLDYARVSPDGSLIAIREVDLLSGTTYIRVIDTKDKNKKIKVAEDMRAGTLSLFFMQNPTVTISNRHIAYAVSTLRGPEIEIRALSRNDEGALKLGARERIKAHESGLIQISSLAISPDDNELAVIGLVPKGWNNLYRVPLKGSKLTQLTNEPYAWRTLHWGEDGILGASDRTANKKFGIFHVDPGKGTITPLLTSAQDLGSPEGTRSRFVFQSWASGSSQTHLFENGRESQLTDVKTGLFHPQLRGDALFNLGFKSGRYHLYKIARDKQLSKPGLGGPAPLAPPWQPVLADFAEESGPQEYRPFKSTKPRIDDLMAFYGSGGLGGIAGVISDLMRDYTISGEFAALGGLRFSNASVFLGSSRGRSSWITGGYHTTQPRIDSLLANDDEIRSYIHRESGILGAIQYPLGPFSYFDTELRLAGVNRSNFNDPVRESEWQSKNPGLEFLAAPMFRMGYDRVQYEPYAGPLKGFGLLLESDTSFFPRRESITQRFRLDGAYYIQAVGRTVIALQLLAGAAFGGDFKNPFFVSSDDILRAYPFGDERLQGNYVTAGKAEIRFPIGTFFGVPPLRGIAGYDYGSIFSRKANIERNIAASWNAGLSLNLPPLGLSFIFAQPLRTAPGPKIEGPVFHFLFRYLYL